MTFDFSRAVRAVFLFLRPATAIRRRNRMILVARGTNVRYFSGFNWKRNVSGDSTLKTTVLSISFLYFILH